MGRSFSWSSFICWYACRYNMSVELPFSTITRLMVKPTMFMVMTSASSWGWWVPLASSSLKEIIWSSKQIFLGGRWMTKMSGGAWYSSCCRTSYDGPDFSYWSKLLVLEQFFRSLTLQRMSIGWMTNIFLKFPLLNEHFHLFFQCHAIFNEMTVILMKTAI